MNDKALLSKISGVVSENGGYVVKNAYDSDSHNVQWELAYSAKEHNKDMGTALDTIRYALSVCKFTLIAYCA